MKRALIICLFVLISEKSVGFATPYFPPLQPMDAPTESPNNSSNITSNSDPFTNASTNVPTLRQNPNTNITTTQAPDYSNISKIEQSLFGNSFENQNISIRLSKIEKKLFNTTYPNANSNKRIDNIISNCDQASKYPNISKNVLSDLESKVFGQKYPQNGPARRIERLEQQVFGAIQSGDLNARYDTLRMAVKAYNDNKYANNDIAPATRGFGRGISIGMGGRGMQGMGGSFGNPFMSGRMTGFTPPIGIQNDPFFDDNNNFGSSSFGNNNYGNNAYNNNPTSYYNPRKSAFRTIGSDDSGSSSSYRDNHGGYYEGSGNRNTQTGVGVTILD